jgi:hypothetical protein
MEPGAGGDEWILVKPLVALLELPLLVTGNYFYYEPQDSHAPVPHHSGWQFHRVIRTEQNLL